MIPCRCGRGCLTSTTTNTTCSTTSTSCFNMVAERPRQYTRDHNPHHVFQDLWQQSRTQHESLSRCRLSFIDGTNDSEAGCSKDTQQNKVTKVSKEQKSADLKNALISDRDTANAERSTTVMEYLAKLNDMRVVEAELDDTDHTMSNATQLHDAEAVSGEDSLAQVCMHRQEWQREPNSCQTCQRVLRGNTCRLPFTPEDLGWREEDCRRRGEIA